MVFSLASGFSLSGLSRDCSLGFAAKVSVLPGQKNSRFFDFSPHSFAGGKHGLEFFMQMLPPRPPTYAEFTGQADLPLAMSEILSSRCYSQKEAYRAALEVFEARQRSRRRPLARDESRSNPLAATFAAKGTGKTTFLKSFQDLEKFSDLDDTSLNDWREYLGPDCMRISLTWNSGTPFRKGDETSGDFSLAVRLLHKYSSLSHPVSSIERSVTAFPSASSERLWTPTSNQKLSWTGFWSTARPSASCSWLMS